jgi:hypothetical protein
VGRVSTTPFRVITEKPAATDVLVSGFIRSDAALPTQYSVLRTAYYDRI